jgi:glycerophosphoryl diester phosphodiesterase
VSSPSRIVFGHRGASIELPENTLEAFARALELGVDVIETDVHVTADEHVVIHHDDSSQRMGCDARLVCQRSLADLKRVNVGFGFRDRAGRGIEKSFRVPTLSEALEAFPSARFNIDIKPLGAVPRVLETVRRHAAEERVLLTSFYDANVRQVRAAGYRGETGLARTEALIALGLPAFAPAFMRPKGHRIQLPPRLGRLQIASPRVIKKLQSIGYRVDFWVVNDAAQAAELFAAGADGVMTDDPATVVPARKG